jgi:hypothetical protein
MPPIVTLEPDGMNEYEFSGPEKPRFLNSVYRQRMSS